MGGRGCGDLVLPLPLGEGRGEGNDHGACGVDWQERHACHDRFAQRALLSEADYLAREEESRIRHEFVNGEMYAMSGGTQRHNRIAGNVYVALSQGMRGKPCQVFVNDVKLNVARDEAYYYPDVMVVCGESYRVAGDAKSVTDPVLVVEVLSPSTENIDRREKLASYRRLHSLVEYVLISQDKQQVEIYRRQGDIGWFYLSFEANDEVTLSSLAITVPVQDLYAGTDVA
ncbi:MAG: Uma2 family endonuclease [Methylococcaceae bacterium]|nr:MAG: Uma2 family endonuclease [Methylococcaceae bacterium]